MLAVNGESFAANFPQFGQQSHEVAAENSPQFQLRVVMPQPIMPQRGGRWRAKDSVVSAGLWLDKKFGREQSRGHESEIRINFP